MFTEGGLEITTYEDKKHADSSFTNKLIAPEVSKQAMYDQRVDVFSLGVVFTDIAKELSCGA